MPQSTLTRKLHTIIAGGEKTHIEMVSEGKEKSYREVCTRFWWGNLSLREHWRDQDVDGRIILRWIFRKWKGLW